MVMIDPTPHPHRASDHPHYSPTLRTLLALIAVVFITVLLTVIVTSALNDDTTPPPSTPYVSANGDSPVAPNPGTHRLAPLDLTVRALIPPSSPSAQDFADSEPGSTTVTTAALFLATPGRPVPDVPINQLAPAGQAALRCTKVADTAIRSLCEGSALTPYGSITFAGATLENDALADPPSADITLTITGGTDRLLRASGTLSITSLTHTQQDWEFDLR